jgi:hypothetical protein
MSLHSIRQNQAKFCESERSPDSFVIDLHNLWCLASRLRARRPMRFDRTSLIILIALAAIQLLPFGATFASSLALLFLVRVTLVMRTAAFAHPRPFASLARSARLIRHRLSKAA